MSPFHLSCVTVPRSCHFSEFDPFKPQYSHTNSPNWSPYISMKNKLREFHERSKHFPSGVIVLILTTYSLDCVLMYICPEEVVHIISLWERGHWGLIETARLQKRKLPKPTRKYWSKLKTSKIELKLLRKLVLPPRNMLTCLKPETALNTKNQNCIVFSWKQKTKY